MSSKFEAIADIHTHGEDTIERQAKLKGGKRYSNQSLFSGDDIDLYQNKHKMTTDGRIFNSGGRSHVGYMVGPNGGLFMYDPDKSYQPNYQPNAKYEWSYHKPIFSGAPSDVNTPPYQRLNQINPNKNPNALPANFDPSIHILFK